MRQSVASSIADEQGQSTADAAGDHPAAKASL